MSDDLTPEWLRLKRELEAQLRGVWDTIHRLEDRLAKAEKPVSKDPEIWKAIRDAEDRLRECERRLDQLQGRSEGFSVHPREPL